MTHHRQGNMYKIMRCWEIEQCNEAQPFQNFYIQHCTFSTRYNTISKNEIRVIIDRIYVTVGNSSF